MVRASSGSRFSISSIEPLMSANRAVTILRSPSGRALVDGRSVAASACSPSTIPGDSTVCGRAVPVTARGLVRVSGAAHSSQYFAPGRLPVPHCGQLTGMGAAHSLQNFAPARFSAPQFEQCIAVARSQFRILVGRL